jgi:hypothetical protein
MLMKSETNTPKFRPVGDQLWTDTLGRKTATTIDTKGNRWVWNCGWWHVDKHGKPLNQVRPLGHAQFRRAVTILKAGTPKAKEVLHGMDRPGRAWRRFVERDSWVHELFGSCYLLASDGCHAVIETLDGEHKYVCFENLSENTGIALPPRGGKDKPATEKRKKVVSSLLAKYMTKFDTPA